MSQRALSQPQFSEYYTRLISPEGHSVRLTPNPEEPEFRAHDSAEEALERTRLVGSKAHHYDTETGEFSPTTVDAVSVSRDPAPGTASNHYYKPTSIEGVRGRR